MKKLIVMALVACFAVSAFAGIGIEWTTQSPGIFWNGATGTSAKTEEALLALNHSDVLWQLIFAGSDGVANPVDQDNAAGGYVSGDDVVWADRTLYKNSTGAAYNENLATKASDGTQWQVRGTLADGSVLFKDTETVWTSDVYVYQRVFGFGDGTLDPAGLYYYESEPVKVNTAWDPMTPSDLVLLNPVAKQGAVMDNFIPSVPEPATMSLLGLGALAMALRRKLRK